MRECTGNPPKKTVLVHFFKGMHSIDNNMHPIDNGVSKKKHKFATETYDLDHASKILVHLQSFIEKTLIIINLKNLFL